MGSNSMGVWLRSAWGEVEDTVCGGGKGTISVGLGWLQGERDAEK